MPRSLALYAQCLIGDHADASDMVPIWKRLTRSKSSVVIVVHGNSPTQGDCLSCRRGRDTPALHKGLLLRHLGPFFKHGTSGCRAHQATVTCKESLLNPGCKGR